MGNHASCAQLLPHSRWLLHQMKKYPLLLRRWNAQHPDCIIEPRVCDSIIQAIERDFPGNFKPLPHTWNNTFQGCATTIPLQPVPCGLRGVDPGFHILNGNKPVPSAAAVAKRNRKSGYNSLALLVVTSEDEWGRLVTHRSLAGVGTSVERKVCSGENQVLFVLCTMTRCGTHFRFHWLCSSLT